ncbi:sensor histidine kinase [Actinomadura barringtoniae]|uniref:histidine kinase n=1 Tax=Actinomadura barringtoniae TaxID=1427535 RepID=A0A939T7L2_9ACTN|nr:sensor histidine kinase [Actinomadura barringtoniae]
MVVDALLAAVLFAAAIPREIHEPARPVALGWVLQAGLVLPLAWRRVAPLTTFAVVAALAFTQWQNGVLVPTGDVAVLIALHAVAAHTTLRKLALAFTVAELGVTLAAIRWAPNHETFKAFVLLSGLTTAAAVLGLNQRTRKAYTASLEDRAARAERERDQQAQIIAAEERARIARDVHDIVTHSLSVMIALADGAAYALPTAPDQAADAIDKASTVGRQAIAEMQRVLEVLRSGADDLPARRPQPALQQLDGLIAEVRAAGLPVEIIVEGKAPAMPSGAELTIYRVVQEALTNTRKHTAPGTAARVRIAYDPETVDIEIVDDGTASPPERPHGHGLTGMRERVAVYGGRLEAGPRPSGGWRVHTTLKPAELRSAP